MAEWVWKVNQIDKVKFQPVPARIKYERNSDPADLGKKVTLEWSGLAPDFSRDSRISETKGINFFACVQDLFDEALSPQYGLCHLGRDKLKGNVLRGW
jgi:hypothetical protein